MLHIEKPLEHTFQESRDRVAKRQFYWQKFRSMGLPTRKEEAWKYTALQALYKKHGIARIYAEAVTPEAAPDLSSLCLSKAHYNLVIYDGVLLHNEIKHRGVKLTARPPMSESELDGPQYATRYLNQATAVGGFTLALDCGVRLDKPVMISYIHSQKCDHAVLSYRNQVLLDAGADCHLYEQQVSLSQQKSALNLETRFILKNGASCIYDKVSKQDESGLLSTRIFVIEIGKDAKFQTFCSAPNAILSRDDFIVRLMQKGASFDAKGLYILGGKTHNDYHFDVRHLASHTESVVDFKGIVSESTKAVFNASAFVDKNLQGIKALQCNNNLQLSATCEINTKPELEIYSDDVVCTHGVTIGWLDQAALFYLTSRGIPLTKAHYLLMEAFAKEVILKLSRDASVIEDYINVLERRIKNILPSDE